MSVIYVCVAHIVFCIFVFRPMNNLYTIHNIRFFKHLCNDLIKHDIKVWHDSTQEKLKNYAVKVIQAVHRLLIDSSTKTININNNFSKLVYYVTKNGGEQSVGAYYCTPSIYIEKYIYTYTYVLYANLNYSVGSIIYIDHRCVVERDVSIFVFLFCAFYAYTVCSCTE